MYDGDFNSIKVRLKPEDKRMANYVYKFQFHKGTIKTIYQFIYASVLMLFQFHKGTIKTTVDQLNKNSNRISIP